MPGGVLLLASLATLALWASFTVLHRVFVSFQAKLCSPNLSRVLNSPITKEFSCISSRLLVCLYNPKLFTSNFCSLFFGLGALYRTVEPILCINAEQHIFSVFPQV